MTAVTANGRSQIHEDVELLKLTGACDGQQASDGAFTVLAAIAKTDLPPLNGVAQRAFRDVVRRLDPLLVHERKEVRMMGKQRAGEIARIDVGDVDGSFGQREEGLLERAAPSRSIASRVRGPPRTRGSPRNRCHSRNRRRCRASASRQKRFPAAVLASSWALRRFRVTCDQQYCRWLAA